MATACQITGAGGDFAPETRHVPMGRCRPGHGYNACAAGFASRPNSPCSGACSVPSMLRQFPGLRRLRGIARQAYAPQRAQMAVPTFGEWAEWGENSKTRRARIRSKTVHKWPRPTKCGRDHTHVVSTRPKVGRGSLGPAHARMRSFVPACLPATMLAQANSLLRAVPWDQTPPADRRFQAVCSRPPLFCCFMGSGRAPLGDATTALRRTAAVASMPTAAAPPRFHSARSQLSSKLRALSAHEWP